MESVSFRELVNGQVKTCYRAYFVLGQLHVEVCRYAGNTKAGNPRLRVDVHIYDTSGNHVRADRNVRRTIRSPLDMFEKEHSRYWRSLDDALETLIRLNKRREEEIKEELGHLPKVISYLSDMKERLADGNGLTGAGD